MSSFFSGLDPVRYDPEATGIAFRHYDADKVVMGKPLKDHLRFAVAYWHSFAADGSDPFGAGTFGRPWFGDSMEDARQKADAAFEMFRILGQPFFCFHDHDVRPETNDLRENHKRLNEIADIFETKMSETGTGLLWGTANLFTHPRFMAGGATNPDPEVFAWSASTVRSCLEVTHRLKGENYVLWGGREGYESLLNTDMAQDLDHYGRFLSMVVEHKHKIGFTGQILVEPKPQEPSKHQYDHDVATVYGFLRRYGLEDEVKVNVEQGHAILAGHSFEHEIALARDLGILGSIDMNRNDYQSGWDTDQFPNNVPEVALAYYEILKGGGLAPGGTNFDAKLRRQSIDAEDLIAAHAGAMDICARGLMAAARMFEDDALEAPRRDRYAGWSDELGRAIMAEDATLSGIADRAEADGLSPAPKSGRQEILENIVSRYV
ncbi:xylose isomerase [Palleronia aestuarii]|uniref:Xylose isomerase n=1 Tax=Palleronia aestuarii TaxID=568105 RepID=A0A2W7NAC9_9RHOB|nr:xylose isomerase [Palleronia aestuarii]PZX16960.1 xylose isomerase [Palleronia aestuarii]